MKNRLERNTETVMWTALKTVVKMYVYFMVFILGFAAVLILLGLLINLLSTPANAHEGDLNSTCSLVLRGKTEFIGPCLVTTTQDGFEFTPEESDLVAGVTYNKEGGKAYWNGTDLGDVVAEADGMCYYSDTVMICYGLPELNFYNNPHSPLHKK